ncbi:MAG: Flp pilus assembly protein CpaB [Bacteriovoracaceae bacterium]
MNSRAFTLSLVIACVAMFMVYSYIAGQEADWVKKFGKLVPVVRAKVDINELDLVDDSKVYIENVPQQFAQPGVFSNVKDIYNTVATVPIKKDEQITSPRVTYPDARTGLARQVSIGKRAISIQLSEEQSVSRLLKPGDRVDILALVDYAGGRKEFNRVKTILQDVLVLATGLAVTNTIPLVGVRTAEEIKKLNLNTYNSFNTVTLELNPFEVQKLIYIISAASGRIFLSLRNNDDKQIQRISGSKLFDILGEDAGEAKAFFQEQKAREQARGGAR